MAYHYVIKKLPETPNGEGERVTPDAIRARVDELAAREGVSYYLRKLNRAGDRVYIAANGKLIIDGEARRGFIVEYARDEVSA
jgi:hypothetical protein